MVGQYKVIGLHDLFFLFAIFTIAFMKEAIL